MYASIFFAICDIWRRIALLNELVNKKIVREIDWPCSINFYANTHIVVLLIDLSLENWWTFFHVNDFTYHANAIQIVDTAENNISYNSGTII